MHINKVLYSEYQESRFAQCQLLGTPCVRDLSESGRYGVSRLRRGALFAKANKQ